MSKQNMLQIIRDHKALFIVIGVLLLLIEIEIFAIAAMKSGRKATIQVLNAAGAVVYEADGKNLSQFDKYYFEQNFGPLENYEIRFISTDVPFPFRAWFVAAFGIPVGAMLLFAFLVRAYLAVFYGDTAAIPFGDPRPAEAGQSRVERMLLRVSRFNIFVIGFLILVGIFAYWVVPNLITYLSRVGIETLVRYKWAVIGTLVVALGMLIWVIYLRFLLAKKSIESRTELERYRLELEYQSGKAGALPDASDDRPLVGWTPGDADTERSPREDRPI